MTPIFFLSFGGVIALISCLLTLAFLRIDSRKRRGGTADEVSEKPAPVLEDLCAEMSKQLRSSSDIAVARLESRVAAMQENIDWLATDRMLEVTSEMARAGHNTHGEHDNSEVVTLLERRAQPQPN